MKATDLPRINDKRDNVHSMPWPYQGLRREQAGAADTVVFFGSDFLNMGAEVDPAAYAAKANQCLNFIRRTHPQDTLWYKPHPNEKDERSMLDLSRFSVIAEDMVSEVFILKHFDKLKATYATVSSSPIFAWRVGIDSHTFLPFMEDVFDETSRRHIRTYFTGMPETFLIRDITAAPGPCTAPTAINDPWSDEIQKLASTHGGDIWVVVCETKFLPAILSLALLIRNLFPQRRLVLVVIRHGQRWSPQTIALVQDAFDEIFEFPRLFYSLKPQRLWAAIRTARTIRNIKLSPNDILFGFAPHDFIENCFVSYHKESLKAVFMEESVFNIHFKPHEIGFLRDKDLRFDKASWFYNKIFEPLLGLHRSLFLRYSFGLDHYISRPEEPINDIYDKVYLFTNR